MRTTTKTALATIAFAALHSALASRTAKRTLGDLVGSVAGKRACESGAGDRDGGTGAEDSGRDTGYRLFFVGQSLLSFAALLAYTASMPKRTVYRATGATAGLLRAGQLAGVLHLIAGLRQIGLRRWAGVDNLHSLRARRAGQPRLCGPVAQGPEILEDGQLNTGGVFRWSRHPLNLSGMPIFWLTPHMTTRRLAFNAVSSAYFILGSLHEEARLRRVYGEKYRAYAESQVPFFWPSPRALLHSARRSETDTT